MSDRARRIFLITCIVAPFLAYCVYYYSIMIGNAPFKFSEFESITLNYGLGDSLINKYNSKTGEYQYLNTRDSLIKTNVKLRKDDLLYLHRKAVELNFWNMPTNLTAEGKKGYNKNTPHYYLEFKYKRKSKHILFDTEYSANEKIRGAASQLIDEVSKMIIATEDKNK